MSSALRSPRPQSKASSSSAYPPSPAGAGLRVQVMSQSDALEMFASESYKQGAESLAVQREGRGVAGPGQFVAARPRRHPDLTDWSIGTDHELGRSGIFKD